MDKISAIVQKVVPNGRHGPYAVASCEMMKCNITFSLAANVWRETGRPETGVVVILSNLRKKRAGWRATEARFFKPTDEQTHNGGGKQ